VDRNIVGLLGAMGALAAAAPGHAATSAPLTADTSMQVTSYADLLKPIPNALALMKAPAAANAETSLLAPAVEGEATVEDTQFLLPHHHHHHHHRYYRRPRHQHHHHHHHHDHY
jgi:hypothetical protein